MTNQATQSIHSSKHWSLKIKLTDLYGSPTDGSKGSRRTSRTQTCTITPSPGKETLTGASSSPSITSWLRRRSSFLRKSPCSPGMRLSIRSLLASRYRSGTPTTSLLMTSWVRNVAEHLAIWSKISKVLPSLSFSMTTLRGDWVGP